MSCKTICKFILTSVLVIVVVLIAVSGWKITRNKSEKLEVMPNEPWDKPRLSPDAVPYLYHLLLHPNLRTGLFKGTVTISITLKSAHEHLAIHIKGLNVTKTEITTDNEAHTKVELRDTFEFAKNEVWVMVAENEIQPGKYKLFMEFNGKLTNKIVGFYQSVYKDSEGEERRIATTKFEPTFARQAFPCFDEPNFKARYDIELVKPSTNEYMALSNMNKISQEINKPEVGLTTVKFATSLPMSTYLACFIICDFGHLEPAFTDKGLPITVYVRKEYVRDVEYAKHVALIATNFYTSYFNIDYPLPKLDLIAIPDFVSGAMENWGLITFRETRLLCAPGSSVGNMLAVALTVSHEIAHMWFGDLVTMNWWNDLWLNEGFATFVEYKATAQVHPQWELDNIFLSQELYHVLKLDATLSSHPIVQPVSHPDQITEIFDSISYNKGASVLRMLEATIGEENFQKGVTSYLNKFKYSNAETEDLWNHLNEFSPDVNITTFMDTWTRQMGFPVISVQLKENSVTFTQKRYLVDPTAQYDESESPFKYRWEIPLTFITSNSPATVHKIWMKQSEDEVVYNLPSKVDWIKVNYHNIGYYLVNYELAVWEKLRSVLETDPKVFDPADRSELLNDVFSLAESEVVPYDVALKMTKYLPADKHFSPWSVACSQFLLLNRRLYGTNAYSPFLKYVNSLIKDLKIMTWNLDDRPHYLFQTYQNNIIHLGCLVGHPMCLNQVTSLFRQWLSIPAMKLNPELVQLVLYFGVQQTSTQEWDSLWQLYLKEQNPQDKVKMMKALCASRDSNILKKYMEMGKNESYVRSQDYLTLLATMSQNPTATPLVWEFLMKEWNFLVERYTTNDRYLGRLVPEVTYYFATESRYNQLKEFFEKYPDGGAGTSARKSALERIQNNIKWRNKYVNMLTEWFVDVTRNT